MTGLSVGMAYKTGLFNIGAPGQYLAGTTASLFLALSIPSSSVPAWLIWFIAFLGGVLAGALWGAIPGLLKATLNINEVIACIMTNWIAANLVTWIFDISNLKNVVENTKSGYIYKTTFNNVATSKMGLDVLFPDSQVNGGIVAGAVLADIGDDDDLIIGEAEVLLHLAQGLDEVIIVGGVLIVQADHADLEISGDLDGGGHSVAGQDIGRHTLYIGGRGGGPAVILAAGGEGQNHHCSKKKCQNLFHV